MDKNINIPEARKAIGLGKMIAEAIRETSQYPEIAIKAVTKVVYRELRAAGFDSYQLMYISNAILQCVVEEMKEGR